MTRESLRKTIIKREGGTSVTSQSANYSAGQKGQPKVLIVDDQERNLIALETLLSGLDAELIRAGSGNEALASTLDHDFALVLLDLQMPGMDGFEVARLMREAKKTAHVPIIFISAIYSGEIYRIKGVEAGAIDFVEKPIVPAILLGKVRLFLELHEHRRALQKETTQQIVEQVSDGVMIVDSGGIIRLVNPAAVKLYGLSQKALLKSPFGHPLIDGTQEVVLLSDDGQTRIVELKLAPMRWRDEDVYIVSMRDVSERRGIEQKLEAAIKELQSSNEELQSFTYTVSHDLKSPLVTIGGYLGLLEQTLGESSSADVQLCLAEIKTATEKMALLLKHLLDLSRVGRKHTTETIIDLAEMLADVTRYLPETSSGQPVELRLAANLPQLRGDAVRLGQLFMNLCNNAVNYMGDQPHPLIEIGMADTPAGRALFVRDNGMGIPERYQQKIFNLFERLSAETEGTGIGLTLVKKIARLHGGDVWVESAGPGQGSTFWVRLPFVEEGAV